ncbi:MULTISPECIES: hypothetical protein [unclassified Mesorhizobium]|uniref:hypothetical protein n=1 Tax=unclassified Mesorhizobium TaxID=325217 RepID=UPI000F756830|nr:MULTISPECIES: hypothetical protein [unclassified Mesorhizobium]AZO25171.1 hypothetical protein EJ070_34030 [Mesorhizobium sp. M1E.F.Ca.ET.045.02.1.1]RUW22848.1 hypothetical protein EOA38_30590 [Mesorhizobium sp. M1E.F.Ca.ET.041.01.1.1]RUW79499.1 hypothetical protein EOA29_23990 [Mesorhizobium sp. M1E.F.Ca.ET.063.01.1.1]RWD89782.1 MAG: hypothetical protein EOS38_09590 [Mesorhizobium sp.]RWD90606.1 MAG: hypothetical protein EOS39_18940 [Mesorhizobium sp.]
MKSFLSGMALAMAMAAPAAAETRYDRNLEKAVVEIVAGKMGDIRGGFSYKQVAQLVVLPEAAPAAPAPVEPRKQASNNDGLMPAVERPVSQTVF